MDVRDPALLALKIKTVYPRFFFRQCEVCKLEFRKTPMWKWYDDHYACMGCLPNYDSLMKFIKRRPLDPKPSHNQCGAIFEFLELTKQ